MIKSTKKGLRNIVLVLSVLLFWASSASFADEASDRVDKLLVPWNKPGSPGCALAIIQKGKIIYQKGYGAANLELGLPITPDTVFYVGSISKQFVAFAVALLEFQGKLSFDDDIRKYIPEFPDYGSTITIRHLIHHTGGIRGYLMLLDQAGLDIGHYHQVGEVIKELLARQKALNFKPGEKFQYSNSGYLILAEIVCRVSGMSFREFAYKNILKPLNMKNSHFHDDYTELIKNRASSYYLGSDGKYKNFISTFDLVGSGGLYTTARDLFRWDRNFYHCKVGGKEIINTMLTKGKLANNEEINYAFGLRHGEYKGLKTVAHSGSLGGYRSMLLRFPEQQFSVICLSNFAAFDPIFISYQVAEIYLQDQFKPPDPKEKNKRAKVIKLSRKHLENKTGTYRNTENRQILKISAPVENRRLLGQENSRKIVMVPLSKTQFKVVEPVIDIFVEFTRKDKKSPFTIQTFQDNRLISTYELIQPASPTPEELKEYTGKFYSKELNVTYTFVFQEGKLFVKYRRAPNSPLKPTIKDEFTVQGIDFQFTRDHKGKINGFNLIIENFLCIPFIASGSFQG